MVPASALIEASLGSAGRTERIPLGHSAATGGEKLNSCIAKLAPPSSYRRTYGACWRSGKSSPVGWQNHHGSGGDTTFLRLTLIRTHVLGYVCFALRAGILAAPDIAALLRAQLLPIERNGPQNISSHPRLLRPRWQDRKSTRLNSSHLG